MYYPWYDDPNFNEILASKKEMVQNKISKSHQEKRCLENYQYLVSNYINPKSPYDSILLYMSTGVGKTISAISIADNFIRQDSKKQILVVSRSETLISDFKSDLVNICSSYASQSELKSLYSIDQNESRKTRSIINSRIDKNYTFITHSYMKKNADISFTDKVVIIDEVHNIAGNSGYLKVMDIISKSRNYKLVLLSATPAYDNIKDMFEVSNILNGKVNQLQIRDSLKKDGLVNEVKTGAIGNLYRNKVYSLSIKGRESLLGSLKGKVVYLKVDTEQFPSVSYPGSLKSIDGIDLSLGVIKCNMSGTQEKYYNEASTEIKFSSIGGVLEMMSSIIYPDIEGKKVYGKTGIDYYITGGLGDSSFLLEENIKDYSTKLYHLLRNIKKSSGKVYIHSRSITDDGVPVIEKCLKKNGYSKILAITSSMSSANISKNILKFNDPSNDDGSKIRFIIGSGIIAEGVTLKSIRQVHIYEPEWNYSSIDQIQGRAIRKGSHSRLSRDQRSVEVFLYCSVSLKNIEKSVDLAKYRLSTVKDVEIKSFERDIAKNTFTCPLFLSRNIVKGNDGSRECDYGTCSYKCKDYIRDNTPVDSSTYNIYLHNKELYNALSKKIIAEFKKSKQISITDLVKKSGADIEDIMNIMRNKPPVKFTKKGNIFISYTKEKIHDFGKIKKTKTKLDKPRGFMNESGKFSISMTTDGKTNSKVCETGYKKEELISILHMIGVELPNKVSKKTLCEQISRFI